ncbi:hypothetical protein BDK51DRAFT_38858 [Blyttiomyces helicus]|uniref:Galactose oxidase n=1 Tax=Blyttiomyces helicus TaxID=388810 RepID=A0A4P9WBL3_9FUNG|nr:hypothetical protein BDK51DRAFT_38858 [Blyttiomyces helicus]|eukprot:RKO89652.1 hypothetical protein BDK51DRAFT_38858 [Blyttiomyces helicus]
MTIRDHHFYACKAAFPAEANEASSNTSTPPVPVPKVFDNSKIKPRTCLILKYEATTQITWMTLTSAPPKHPHRFFPVAARTTRGSSCSTVLHPDGNSLVVFGGLDSLDVSGESKHHLNDVLVMSLETCSAACSRARSLDWTPVPHNPRFIPAGLNGQSAVVYNQTMVLFGGESENGLNRDIIVYDLLTSLWSSPARDMYRAPCVRKLACTWVVGDQMLVYGGSAEV